MHLRDLVQFLSELEENNNRAWFVMNKPRYDILRAEFLELVTGLIRDITRFDPAVAACNPKKALFRINRDLRFAKDRPPYKTTFSAAITSSGLKKPSQGGGPAYYFHINASGELFTAGGEWRPPADRLREIRQLVVSDPNGLKKVLKSKALHEAYGDLQTEDMLARVPKEFDADAPMADYLRLKSYIAWRQTSIRRLPPEKLSAKILEEFSALSPLVKWLRSAGPTP